MKAEQCYWAGQQNDISGIVDNSPYLSTAPNPVGWGQSDTYDPSFLVPLDPGSNTGESHQVTLLSKAAVDQNELNPAE
ncbi:MAG: hypothetical protein ACRENG_21195 [bacterium]